jgi:hypothetical protein
MLYKIKQTMKAMMFRNGEEEYVEMEITSSVTFMGSGKLL